MDLSPAAFDDSELEQLRVDVLNELERRANLNQAPAQITWLARQYVDAGGDPADIAAAIEGI